MFGADEAPAWMIAIFVAPKDLTLGVVQGGRIAAMAVAAAIDG
jgi:hypothetical protein